MSVYTLAFLHRRSFLPVITLQLIPKAARPERFSHTSKCERVQVYHNHHLPVGMCKDSRVVGDPSLQSQVARCPFFRLGDGWFLQSVLTHIFRSQMENYTARFATSNRSFHLRPKSFMPRLRSGCARFLFSKVSVCLCWFRVHHLCLAPAVACAVQVRHGGPFVCGRRLQLSFFCCGTSPTARCQSLDRSSSVPKPSTEATIQVLPDTPVRPSFLLNLGQIT
jgi:hypothetical protein